MNTVEEIANVIASLDSAVIFSHSRPDGDAIGSALALSFALTKLGIPNEVVNESEIPACFFCLDGAREIKRTPTLDAEAYICVDSSDENRFGALTSVFVKGARKGKITVNLDHHISNTHFCRYNYVRECSANCENMAKLITAMGVKIEGRIADALLAGLITDSGGFSHDDVNGDTFRVAAQLSDAGANVGALTYEVFKKQSLARAKMYAEVISHLRFLEGGRLAVATVSLGLLEKYGLPSDASTGVVDFALTIDEVEVSVCMLEVKRRQYKISFRSKKTDVNKVAAVYGGGGHIRASGCMLFGEEEEVVGKLADAVAQAIRS